MDSQQLFYTIRIDVDLSKNSRLKNMFRQPEFHREIKIYLRHHDLEISKQSANDHGRITSIEVSGSVHGLQFFIDRYLHSDVLGIAYNFVSIHDHFD